MQVKPIRRPQSASRQGEIENQQMPAGAQHSRHLGKSGAPIRHIAQAERDRHAIE
jgi:hypothetical protein